MTSMLQVTDREGGQVVLFPLEEDGTLLSFRIQSYFKGAHGLRYRNEITNTLRGVRFVNGRFYPPEGGWNGVVCFCTGPARVNKGHLKRKHNISLDEAFPEKKMRVDSKPIDLILLGLMHDTTENHIRECFGKYGDLELVSIKRDTNGISKGFGFIRFTDFESQKIVMSAVSPFYSVNGHWCEVKIPNSKIKNKADALAHDSKYLESKIFVGRCALDITPSDLRQYFSRFGEVTHVYVPPNRAKPYAFVTFKENEVAQSLWGEDHTIKGHSVNVRPAEKADPRNEKSTQRNGNLGRNVISRGSPPQSFNSNSANSAASQSMPAQTPIIKDSQLSSEVLMQIRDILVADQICRHHQPVYYTNMLSKKLTLSSLVKILQSQGQLLPIVENFQMNQSQGQAQTMGDVQEHTEDLQAQELGQFQAQAQAQMQTQTQSQEQTQNSICEDADQE